MSIDPGKISWSHRAFTFFHIVSQCNGRAIMFNVGEDCFSLYRFDVTEYHTESQECNGSGRLRRSYTGLYILRGGAL